MTDEERIKNLKAELYDLCVKRGELQMKIEEKTGFLLKIEKENKDTHIKP